MKQVIGNESTSTKQGYLHIEVFIIKKAVKKIVALIKGKKHRHAPTSATVIPRHKHGISRNNISPNALKVLYHLKKNDYGAYLVGGCVRDMLLGREPKDFDIATNALPQEVRNNFRNARLIGRRFRLAHILFHGEIIEVSTFRAERQDEKGENSYGTIDEDANRRDFTMNALYYNIRDFSVLDFHNGLDDIKHGIVRMIGDPELRYREDPVRILRAVRFAAKLGFRIEDKTEEYIFKLGHLLSNISPARLFTEFVKLFMSGMALNTFKLLRHYKLFIYLFPATEQCLDEENFATSNYFLNQALQDTDDRLNANKSVSPGYLIAALLWHPLQQRMEMLIAEGMHPHYALYIAINDILEDQNKYVALPKNFTMIARTIWDLQIRLEKRRRTKCYEVINHPRFRAGYDFLYLRMRSGEDVTSLYEWWTQFYEGDEHVRKELIHGLSKGKPRQKRKKRK